MSQEGGSERTQRTVAELLAKYGGTSGESAPRRRRRKPEDGSETAPQAIIERVMSDSGTMQPITDEQTPPERVSHRQGRTTHAPKPAPQRRQPAPTPPPELLGRPPMGEPPRHEPPRHDPSRQEPRPDQALRPGMRRPEPIHPEPGRPEQARPEPPRPEIARPDAVRHEPTRSEPVRPEPPRAEILRPEAMRHDPARAPRPVSRPTPAEGHTEQIPRVTDDGPEPTEPPAGLAGGPNRLRLLPRRGQRPEQPQPGQRMPQPSQQLPQPSQQLPQLPQPSQQLAKPQPSQPLHKPQPSQPQPSQQLHKPQLSQQLPQPSQQLAKPQVAAKPPLPGGEARPLPTFPPAPNRGAREFPGDASETAIDPRGPRPEFLEDVESFDDRAAVRFTEYQAHDDLDEDFDRDPVRDPVRGDDRDFDDFDDRRAFDDSDLDEDFNPDPRDDTDDDDEVDEEANAGREWAIMAGQLALGVVGGAAVWLAFNWLWGFLPAAALAAALAVIVGLVLIVRKIRKAEDLQTTVLAVLVGLVVTVSPAVLLLLGR